MIEVQAQVSSRAKTKPHCRTGSGVSKSSRRPSSTRHRRAAQRQPTQSQQHVVELPHRAPSLVPFRRSVNRFVNLAWPSDLCESGGFEETAVLSQNEFKEALKRRAPFQAKQFLEVL